MRFEWDAAKNDINIRKHGIDFNDAKIIFHGYTLTIEDDRRENKDHIRKKGDKE